jgi:hypothetical protein
MRSWLRIRRDAEDPVRVGNTRERVEEGFAQAKGEVGLDQFVVRSQEARHRHFTFCLHSHADMVAKRQAVAARGHAARRAVRGQMRATGRAAPLPASPLEDASLADAERLPVRPLLPRDSWRWGERATTTAQHSSAPSG